MAPIAILQNIYTPKAMDTELEQYLPFVKAVAKRYTTNKSDLEELIKVGCVGLVEAKEKYDNDSEIRFISFAVWFIRRSIESYLKGKGFHQ